MPFAILLCWPTFNNFLFTEPGYYEDGKFGIRIENLVVVVPKETKVCDNNQYLCDIEMSTYVGICIT